MVAIFTGAGAGFERGSGKVLGGAGLLGSSALGRAGEQVMLNAANGNLLISHQDEFLVGRGPDAAISRTYNSLGDLSDDNHDNWRQSTDRRVYGLTGAANTIGSTVKRVSADGSVATYRYDGTAYVETDGAGAYDKLSLSGSTWTWVDGDSQTTETYGYLYGGFAYVTEQRDASGNALTSSYVDGKLSDVTTANGERIHYAWSGSNVVEIQTFFNDAGTSRMQTRTRYDYDALGRLNSVAVDLSPEDNSTSDGNRYVTSYGYQGSSRLIAWIAQTDGSRVDFTYDAYNRVASVAQAVDGSATRVTSLAYGADYTVVTDPAGQTTRLDYASGDFAVAAETWNSGNVSKEPALINGMAATKFTVQNDGQSAGISQSVAVAAGETLSFALTLQAVGDVTAQSLGLYSDQTGWGTAGVSTARIISGPGRLEQTVGGLWRVVGLSTTEGTRVEITRTYEQAGTGGAYFYVDNPGNYRAGTALIAGEASLLRSSTASSPDRQDLTRWTATNLTRAAADPIAGATAFKYSVTTGGKAANLQRNIGAIKAGETYSFVITLQGVGGYNSHYLGFGGFDSSWGSSALSSGRILSGPGTLSQRTGGYFSISGLSSTQPTSIEITRTFERDEDGGYARLFVDLANAQRTGASVLVSSTNIVRKVVEPATAGQLLKITAPPASSGAAQAITQFGYSDKGDLVSVTDPGGKVARFGYDASGNLVTETDRNGKIVSRTYDGSNQLRREERKGIAADAETSLATAYVYDAKNRLRYSVSAEGRVTQNSYAATGELVRVDSYTGALFTGADLPTEADLDSWVAGLVDKSARGITINDYDARGALRRTTDYGAADANGAPVATAGYSQTDYVYDQAGQLLHRTVASRNQEHFLYDGLGRVTASTDPRGGITRFAFADVTQQTTVTLASGLVQISAYSRAGDLLSTTESGSYTTAGTATYQYDRLGRARIATDATGRKSYMVYDAIRRKVADVDELGSLTEYRYDSRDRLGNTISYWTALSSTQMALLADPLTNVDISAIRPVTDGNDLREWTVYDDEGRVRQKIDGTYGTIVYTYDASGRLTATTSYYNKLSSVSWTVLPTTVRTPTADPERDVVTRIFYDRDGNVVGRLDGEGNFSRIRYDGAGNKIEEVAFATSVPTASRASSTFNQLLASVAGSAADRVARYVYDGQGLLRFSVDALNNVTEFVYDGGAAGAAVGAVRRTISYAAPIPTLGSYTMGSVRAALDAAGAASNAARRQSFTIYDSQGNLAYEIAATGAVTGYSYDVAGNIIKAIRYKAAFAANSPPSYTAMTDWSAAIATDAENRATRHFYSARGDLVFSVDALGYVTRYDYDAEGRNVAIVRFDAAMGGVGDGTTIDAVSAFATGSAVTTSTTYDAAGRVRDTLDGNGVVTRRSYNVTGTLSFLTLAYGTGEQSRTRYDYDASGRVVATVEDSDGLKSTTRFTYDGLGNVLTETAPDGVSVTTYVYGRGGGVVARTDALGGVTRLEYNAFGEQVKSTDERGNATYTYYDANGRTRTVRDAEGYVTETSYTVFGEVETVTRRFNRATNPAGTAEAPAVTPHANDATTRYGYDQLGRLTLVTDAEGASESTSFNGFGEVAQVRNKAGGVTSYAYDLRGERVSEHVDAAVFDDGGNKVADGYFSHVYEYDARGNLQSDKQGRGAAVRETYYTYDAADRLVEKRGMAVNVGLPGSVASVTPTESYVYDRRGNLTQVTDANGKRTISYFDRLDRKTGEVDPTGAYTTYGYDKNGAPASKRTYATRVSSTTYTRDTRPNPSGEYRETIYLNDALGRLKQTSVAGARVGAWDGSSYAISTAAVTTTAAYDAAGNLTRSTDGNGASVFSYYDRLGRKVAQVDQEGYLTEWTLDANGNVASERRYAQRVAGASETVRPAGVEQADDRVTDFTYDHNGRRLTETRRGVEAWTVDAASGALVRADGDATVTYGYNALGQVASKREATGDTTRYTYDTAGRLVLEEREALAGGPGGGVRPTLSYSYDALGDLVRTVEGGERVTRNVYGADGRLLQSIDAAGGARAYYYDAAGHTLGEAYTRLTAAGGIRREGVTYRYDAAGRLNYQNLANWTSTSWTNVGDYTGITYNAFGEVATRALNNKVQEQFDYDMAGRLWRSTGGDGVWRYYVYDAAGRQTLALESDGQTDVQALTLDQVLALATNNGQNAVGAAPSGVTATVTVYDARGQAVGVRALQRQLDASGARVDLLTARGYSAFGELASETDPRGFTTSYAYNRMGRATAITRPQVAVTGEDGVTATLSPVERRHYDLGGRLVGATDANGAVTTRLLAGGTGYGQADALVATEYHADGGRVVSRFDALGNLVERRDELGRATAMTYDGMGRLLTTSFANSSAVEHAYAYDVLGQRISHTQAGRAAGDAELTDYDIAGRVVSVRAFGGDKVTTSYGWDSGITAGLGAVGGWKEVTTYQNGRSTTETADTFGRVVARTDMADGGGATTATAYDQAGRVASVSGQEVQRFSWYNTGLLAGQTSDLGSAGDVRATAGFAYDAGGNRVAETLVEDGRQLRNATASYDAAGRMTRWAEAGGEAMPAASTEWLYDAAGDIRRTLSVRPLLNPDGSVQGMGTEEQWYRFDLMGRVVLDGGRLEGGRIVRGGNGTSYTYDAAGRRISATRDATLSATVMRERWSETRNDSFEQPTVLRYQGERRESYGWRDNGQLGSVLVADTGFEDDGVNDLVSDGRFTRAAGSADYTYDAVGRLTRQLDRDAAGAAVYDRQLTLDARGLVTGETVSSRQGADTLVTTTTNDHGAGAGYLLGQVAGSTRTTS